MRLLKSIHAASASTLASDGKKSIARSASNSFCRRRLRRASSVIDKDRRPRFSLFQLVRSSAYCSERSNSCR